MVICSCTIIGSMDYYRIEKRFFCYYSNKFLLQALAIIAFNKDDLSSRKTLLEILSLGPTFVVMKFSESQS